MPRLPRRHPHDRSSPKVLIAHRGSSAHAPEQTIAAFELAIAQGADYVEHDLQITRDEVLVCVHDQTLERTTNVADVFPDRFREVRVDDQPTRQWFVRDFTMGEIRELDAGGWFDASFAGERIPTFDEALACVAGRAELCTELKDPGVYLRKGVDMLALCAAAQTRHASGRGRDASPIVQSFHEPTVRRAAAMVGPSANIVLLIEPDDAAMWLDPASLAEAATFATGIGPGKPILEAHPELVGRAHDAGLTVTPWTFRSRARGAQFADLRAEMAYYLDVLDVDGVITDHPDQFPRQG